MAKKKGKNETPALEKAANKSNSGSIGGKRGKRVLTEEQKAQQQSNRAKVTSTSSWTGKLPHTLLHEFCQKRKWGKVEYDMKKIGSKGFIGIAIISSVDPKTRETLLVRLNDPTYDKAVGQGALEPQETTMEARHYAATVALYRLAYNTNTHMMLPPNHKSIWYKLDDFRKSLKKDDRAQRYFCDDPFKQLIEERKEKAIKDKQNESRMQQAAKNESTPVIINSVNNNMKDNGGSLTKKVNKPVRKSTKEVTFSRNVWESANFIDLNESSRQQIENCIKRNADWESEMLKSSNDTPERQELKSKLINLGFRKAHVNEAMLYKDPLSFLLFNLPEDDFPRYFQKRKEDSKNIIEISTLPLQKQITLERLQEFPVSKDEALFALDLYNGSEALAAGYLTQSMIPDLPILGTEEIDNPESKEMWIQELESLKCIFEDKIEVIDETNCYVISLMEKYSLKLKVYRTPNYPQHIPGIVVSTFSKKIKLPNYIKKQVMIKLLHHVKESGIIGGEMIYEIYQWLLDNIKSIIDNPGKLLNIDDMKSSSNFEIIEARKSKMKLNKKNQEASLTKDELSALLDEYKKRILTNNYKLMQDQRMQLPAWKKKDHIVDLIMKNQIVLITGETGSGKSTQVCQFVLDALFTSNNSNELQKKILVTQPRRISAIGLAERVAAERCVPCGEEVGYTIRGVNKSSKFSKIRFMTTGVLVRILQSSMKSLENCIIIIDEVHERSIDTDLLVALLKQIMEKVKTLKIVLMSATVNVDLFHNYFPGLVSSHIEGRTFPIKDYFLEDILDQLDFKIKRNKYHEYDDDDDDDSISSHDNQFLRPTADSKFFRTGQINYDLLCQLVLHVNDKLTSENNSGSIIVFLPGVAEINRLCRMLENNNLVVLPLHSALSAEDQKQVFKKFSKRKVVVSTNIAETSITIDDCVATIDTGKAKIMMYNAKDNSTRLIERFISRAESKQRRGRAGRVREGLSYKLYSKRLYEEDMVEMPTSEINRVALDSLYLSVKAMGIRNVKSFLAKGLEPPPLNALEMAEIQLSMIGLLDRKNEELTQLGKYVSMMPLVDPKYGKLLLFGIIFGCVSKCVLIASILSLSNSPFIGGTENRDNIKQMLKEHGDDGDILAIVDIVEKCLSKTNSSDRGKYMKQHYLSFNKLREIESSISQYYSILSDLGFLPIKYRQSEGSELERNGKSKSILKAILAGTLYPNIARVQLPDMKYLSTSMGSIEKDLEAKQIKYWIRNEEFQTELQKLKDEGKEINWRNNDLPPSTKRAFLHPSSVLFQGNEMSVVELQALQDDLHRISKKTSPTSLTSPFVAYVSTQLTSKQFINGLTPVSTLVLLLFGGVLRYDIDSESLSPGIIMDDWIPIRTWCKNGILLNELRLTLDKAIQTVLEKPQYVSGTQNTSKNLEHIFQLVHNLIEIES